MFTQLNPNMIYSSNSNLGKFENINHDKKIVFVGGVHGVGKSYLCHRIVESFKVEHITASQLIGQYVKHRPDKSVADVKNNQYILSEELRKLKSSQEIIILDGHFCLFNTSLGIEDIPLETFKSISPFAIFVLTDVVESIVERLVERDSNHYNKALIEELQSREIDRAKFISSKLNIPLKILEKSKSQDELMESLTPYFS
jgi:adenylate kinase